MTVVAETPVGEYVRALASTAAVPGGGSAAALAAGMGCALLSMVAKLSLKRTADPDAQRVLQGMPADADRLWLRLLELSQEDVDAYRSVVALRREAAADGGALAAAYVRAAEVPLATARTAAEGLDIHRQLEPIAWAMTASDAEAASRLLRAGLHAALANVAVNLPDLAETDRHRIEEAYEALRRTAG